jgi:hypothetical protein
VGDAEPDDVLGGLAVDPLAVEVDLPAGLDHPAHRAQGRRLARAVGAQDRGDAARLHLEREPVQDLRPPVLRLQPLRLQQRRHQAALPR